MEKIIIAGILFLIAALAFFMSIRAVKEKGFLFNNAYLFASKEERERMNKKPHYRQSAIVFSLIGMIFLLNGIAMLFAIRWMFYIAVAMIFVTLIYAIVSSIALAR